MPMDIRMFFTQKGGNKTTEAKKNEDGEKKGKNKKKLVVIDDGSETEDNTPSPAKKPRVSATETADTKQSSRVEISADLFFSRKTEKKRQSPAKEIPTKVAAADGGQESVMKKAKTSLKETPPSSKPTKPSSPVAAMSPPPPTLAESLPSKPDSSVTAAAAATTPKSTTTHTATALPTKPDPTTATTNTPSLFKSSAASVPTQELTESALPTKPDPTTATTNTPSLFKSSAARVPTQELTESAKLVDECTPEMLSGVTFVFSGVLSSLSRDGAQDLVKTLGGRVTTAVSSKTNYLVVGELLEDGRPYEQGSKYKKASTLPSVQVVKGEEALYVLLRKLNREFDPSAPKKGSPKKASPKKASAKKPAAAIKNPYTNIVNPYAAKPAAATNPYAAKPAVNNPYANSSAKVNPYASSKPAPKLEKSNDTHGLWVDKYKPVSSGEILGNQESVRKLKRWLDTWEGTFNNGRAYGKSFSAPKGPWKAALLSGPPGIGKTTTATLVAKESGRFVLEFNASDVRSKKALKEEVGDVTGSQTIQFQKNPSQPRTKRCIVMDEVDGMGAGDRSGMSELIQMIKNSRVPIICICNDRQSQKIKSLLPYCMDLRYRRPVKAVIAKRAMQIAELEGLSVEYNAAEAIAESCGNDVRQVLNCLQMWASDNSCERLSYKGLKERERSINKDEILRVGLFDAARLLLEGRKGLADVLDAEAAERAHFLKRNDAFFVDYNFTGLLVQQNYLKVAQGQFNDAKRHQKSVEPALENMHLAAHAMSDFAHGEKLLRGEQNWSLLPFLGVLAVKTGFHASGPKGGLLPGYPEFTSWLGRNSTLNKKKRLLHEIQYHMNYRISGSTTELRTSYLPLLRERLMALIKNDDDAAEAIALMDEYGLSRDDVFEKFDEFKMDKKAPAFSSIDSKRKAAFTRTYNQQGHMSQALVAEQGSGGTKKRRGGAGPAETVDPDAIDDDAKNNDQSDEEEEDTAKVLAAFKRKGRKAATKKGTTKKAPGKAKKKK